MFHSGLIFPVTWASPNMPLSDTNLKEDVQLAQESLAFLEVIKDKMAMGEKRLAAMRMALEKAR